MKWFFVLFCLVTLSHSQTRSKTELSIAEILLTLSEKTGYDISFTSDKDLETIIDVDLSDKNLERLLYSILPASKYSISIDYESKRIVIKRKFITISGTIMNNKTGLSVPYVNVYLQNKSHGSLANEFGFFSFYTDNFEKDTIVFSAIGYQTKKQEIAYTDDLNDLNVSINYKSILDTINVVNAFEFFRYDEGRHQITISKSDLQYAPMSGENDIFDNLKYVSDITAGETNNFALSLNSGGIHDNLFLIDGMRLFHTDHYFGNFSVFDGDAVNSIAIYPINIPQKFTSVLSGVVELFTREGNTEKPSFSVSLNPINMNVTYGQKFSEKFNLFVQARRSLYDYYESDQFNFYKENEITSLNSRSSQENIDLYFYDYLTRVTYNINSKNQLRLTYFKSGDFNKTKYNNVNYFTLNDYSLEKRNWGNTAKSLGLYSQMSNQSYLNFTVSKTDYWSIIKTDIFTNGGVPSSNLTDNDNTISYFHSSILFHQSVSKNYQYEVGVDYSDFKSSYKDDIDSTQTIKTTSKYPELYMNNEIQISNKHRFEIGWKFVQLSKVNEEYFLPRVTYLYKINNAWSSSLAYSEHTEMIAQQSTIEPLSSHLYDRWIPTESLSKRPLAKHYTFVLGYQFDQSNSYQLKIYQKRIKDNFINYYTENGDTQRKTNFQDVFYNGFQFSLKTQLSKYISTRLTYNYFYDELNYDNEDYGNYTYSRHNFKSMTVYDINSWRFTLSSKHIFSKQLNFDIENQFTLAEDRKDYMIIDFSALHIMPFQDFSIEMGIVLKNILNQSNKPTKFDPENPINISKPQVYLSYEEIFQGFSSLFQIKLTF